MILQIHRTEEGYVLKHPMNDEILIEDKEEVKEFIRFITNDLLRYADDEFETKDAVAW